MKYHMMKHIEELSQPIRKFKEAHPSLFRSLPNFAGIFLALLAAKFGLLQALASQTHPHSKEPASTDVSMILIHIIFMVLIATIVVSALFVIHQRKKQEIPPLPILRKREVHSK